jgi:hypothetical protein
VIQFLILLLIPIVLFCGCTQPTHSTPVAQDLCIQLCNSALNADQNLDTGPCLSDNNDEWNVNDWVCDIAHSPRLDIDNLPENQCLAYTEGQAHHFVEVDENCKLIRVY